MANSTENYGTTSYRWNPPDYTPEEAKRARHARAQWLRKAAEGMDDAESWLRAMRVTPDMYPDISATTLDDIMVTVSIYSFSYKRGVPGDEAGNGGGFVFDCRALPNPFWEDDLAGYTGMDAPVIEFFRRHRQPVDDFLAAAETLVRQSIEQYLDDGREHLQVAFGCTGGQHRSVFCAEQMAKRLRGLTGVRVKVVHAAKEYWKIGEAVFGAD